MNKKQTHAFRNYNNSIRTSGEVEGLFFREKEVICTLVVFITTKLHLFYETNRCFLFSNKFKIKC